MRSLQDALQYSFRDEALLRLALTHPSTKEARDNQRLEFLGDSVLEFVVSDILFHKYPERQEGELTARRASLVCEETLCFLARELSLGPYLHMGHGEESTSGREKPSILADAMEAVIAAIYLDGGMEACRDVVERLVLRRLDRGGDLPPLPPPDAKSRLQEYAQSRKLPMPKYVLVAERGPEHAKTFTVEARIGKTALQQAEGTSKKAASQRAAELALEAMEQSEAEPQGGPSVDAGTVDA